MTSFVSAYQSSLEGPPSDLAEAKLSQGSQAYLKQLVGEKFDFLNN